MTLVAVDGEVDRTNSGRLAGYLDRVPPHRRARGLCLWRARPPQLYGD
ncbi:hypothetical protein OHA25_48800 [Nonomuraea sp. NBC_00507]